MSNTAALNKSTASTATAGTSQMTPAGQPSTLVAGESQHSVNVQSQLATSTVAGKGNHNSNLTQVVSDLGAAHNAHTGWLEAETLKITEWGTGEIQRLLAQTKGVEERLIADAQGKQRLLEESFKGDLARAVQELDAKKAMKLKELEDDMQRQIQAALNTSKKDINNIESEMNKRKMALMTQAQSQTAKDVDRLSNLAVEAKLIPSSTRTIIETNTATGTVIAVAGGGEISTGSAAAQSIRSENVQAAPAPGTLVQTTDVKTGDIRRNDNDAKVGTGAIVSTMSEVTQAPHAGQTLNATKQAPLTHQQPIAASHPVAQSHPIAATHPIAASHPVVASHPIAAAAPLAHERNVTVTSVGDNIKQADAAYAHTQQPSVLVKLDDPHAKAAVSDVPNYDHQKHAATDSHHTTVGADGKPHKEGLMSKIKHAISGEPKTSDASRRL